MADEQKDAGKGFQSFCQSMPFGDMMKKMMMEAGKGGFPCDCAEMMARMKKMCCGSGEKKGEASQESKENPGPKQ